MYRLFPIFRLLVVTIASPVIFLYAIALMVLRPRNATRGRLHIPLRVWMGIADWVKGIPLGYSYWERYEAPELLSEIEVHHQE